MFAAFNNSYEAFGDVMKDTIVVDVVRGSGAQLGFRRGAGRFGAPVDPVGCPRDW